MPAKWVLFVITGLCVSVDLTQGRPACAGSPSTRWKVGDILNFDIEPAGKQPYRMHVMMVGVESVKGTPCWQLNCHPNNDAPAYLKRYRLFVDKKTGCPLRALRLPELQEIAVETAGHASFLTALPEGMPLELFNAAEFPYGKADIAGTTRRIEVRKEEKVDHFFVELALFDNDVEEWKVRQQWAAGEKWWHSYERTLKGQKTLTAKRMYAKPFGSTGEKDPAEEWAKFAKFHPLGLDPKLRRRLDVVQKHPKLADLLNRLGTCTGLNFTLADNLTSHDPDIGDVKLPNVPVFSVMEMITDKDLDDGRWEITTDGYMLTGTPKALTLLPRRFPWIWAGGSAAVAQILLIAGTYYLLRRRRFLAISPAALASPDPADKDGKNRTQP